ncbi:MAG TPA: hypothetical protein VIH82_14980 [Acidimicrobiia bacterium]
MHTAASIGRRRKRRLLRLRPSRPLEAAGLRVLVAGIVVGVLSVASVASAEGAALSEQQWRKKVNAICARAEKRSHKVQEDAFGDLKRDEQPSIEQMTTYVEGVEPIVTGVADGIAALDEPKKLEAKVKRFVRTMRRELARLVADPSLGLEGNPFSDTTINAEALHLSACS